MIETLSIEFKNTFPLTWQSLAAVHVGAKNPSISQSARNIRRIWYDNQPHDQWIFWDLLTRAWHEGLFTLDGKLAQGVSLTMGPTKTVSSLWTFSPQPPKAGYRQVSMQTFWAFLRNVFKTSAIIIIIIVVVVILLTKIEYNFKSTIDV